jgi:hypothetical protein
MCDKNEKINKLSFIPLFHDNRYDDAFGYLKVYGDGVERYIVSDIVLFANGMAKQIFKRNFYEKKFQYNTYWLKETEPCISYNEIRGGSKQPVPTKCNDWIVEVIHNYLVNNEKAVVIFEDILYHISDKNIKDTKLYCFEELGDLYYFLTHENYDGNQGIITEIMDRIAAGFTDVIILTSYDNPSRISSLNKNNYESPIKETSIMIDNAKTVFLMAFDRQGFLKWDL